MAGLTRRQLSCCLLLATGLVPRSLPRAGQVPQIRVDCIDGWLRFDNLLVPVVLPREQFRLPVTGTVTRTDTEPTWWPTPNTRAAYQRQHGRELPRAVPYGDPRNAMGDGRIVVAYDQPWMQRFPMNTIRIHGRARASDLHQNLSRGCFRLLDQDIRTLITLIDNRPIRVIYDTTSV